MNNTFLTPEEISELKAIRANCIQEPEFTELIKFLKKNNVPIQIQDYENIVTDIIINSLPDSIVNFEEHKEFKKNNPMVGFSNEKAFVILSHLPKLHPELNKIYGIAKTANLLNTQRQINSKLANYVNSDSFNFDTDSFVMNSNFDFSPYTVEYCNKTLVNNTMAIDKAINNFFDTLTKDLNEEQKTILSKNLFNTINYFITNSDNSELKGKGNDFKNLTNYISNIS